MTVSKLKKLSDGAFACPVCQGTLIRLEGGQVRVVNGKVDYDNIMPKHVCLTCNKFYRELLNTGYYDVFDAQREDLQLARQQAEKMGILPDKPKQRQIKRTGDLEPVQLKRDANNQAVCPRCGAMMAYLEPDTVKIVNGRADMSDTVARFHCDECSSMYRRIATTDYYQWSEK